MKSTIKIFSLGTVFLTNSLWAQESNVTDNNELPVSTSDFTDLYQQVSEPRGLGGIVGYGRGASFVDIDNDGEDDLFVADTDGRLFGPPFGISMIYVNEGSGNFLPG